MKFVHAIVGSIAFGILMGAAYSHHNNELARAKNIAYAAGYKAAYAETDYGYSAGEYDIASEGAGKINRGTRYENKNWSTKISVWSAKGHTLDPVRLHATICAVIARCTYVPNDYGVAQLVLETIEVESKRTHVSQLGGGPALGLIQMEPATYTDLMNFLRRTPHKDVYKQVMGFYESKNSLEYNLKHNVPFQIALVLANYWRKSGNLLASFAQSEEARWTLYKLTYNSTLGATTREKYLHAAEQVAIYQPTDEEFE